MSIFYNAKHVRFSRFIMTVLIASYALFGVMQSMYIMLIMTLSTILFTVSYSFSTLLFKLLSLVKFDLIFHLNPRYQRSFVVNREMELFEETLRFLVGSISVALYHFEFFIASTVLAFFLAVMMLISTYFGFCASGLLYVAYCKVLKKGIYA